MGIYETIQIWENGVYYTYYTGILDMIYKKP